MSYKKVGGLHFARVGRLTVSWSVKRSGVSDAEYFGNAIMLGAGLGAYLSAAVVGLGWV